MAPRQNSVSLRDVIIKVDGTIITGAQGLTVTWAQENTIEHEGGSFKPREIRSGAVGITGQIEQLYLTNDNITRLINIETGESNYFTITGTIANKLPKRKVTIVDAKFKGFNLEFGLDDSVKVPMEFDALDIKL